jgi:hypothetical protein
MPLLMCRFDVCGTVFASTMSVFQLHDWWTALPNSSTDEDFDIGAMAIGNIDNASPSAGLGFFSALISSLTFVLCR